LDLAVALTEFWIILRLSGRLGAIEQSRPFPWVGAPMVRFLACLSMGLFLATPSLAQQSPVTAAGALPIFEVELDKIEWSKTPGTGPLEFATVVGDRKKPGLYIQLVRWPPHAMYKAHSHPDDRYAVVLRGTFYHGFGDKFDESKLEPRPAGTFFTEPKGVRHFGVTKDEGTVLYFVGTGPSTNDDPEK
jgi:quercetin dioxygenase-like cupin family protein